MRPYRVKSKQIHPKTERKLQKEKKELVSEFVTLDSILHQSQVNLQNIFKENSPNPPLNVNKDNKRVKIVRKRGVKLLTVIKWTKNKYVWIINELI